MEKEIWKWILDTFPDDGIANIADNLMIKIKGFRQLNPQQANFKMVRNRIIKEALNQKNSKKLYYFFDSLIEDRPEIESLRGKSIEELLQVLEEEGLYPSILLGVLLSSEDEEDHGKAQEIYIKLKEEEKLDLLEKQVDEKLANEEEVDEQEILEQLQKGLKTALKEIERLEKKLKKLEQKNEELKTKEASSQTSLKNERKEWKTEKKAFLQEIHSLKAEMGTVRNDSKTASAEKEELNKKLAKQTETMKLKDEEINRLHARVVKLETDLENQNNHHKSGNDKIKVTMIGDPYSSRLLKYDKFELTILKGSEFQEEKGQTALDHADQVWLLTYKIPRSVQKRVKSVVKNKQTKEFTTFADLEDHMLKGMF